MRSNRWVTPVVIVVLLLAFGLLTVIAPAITQGISRALGGGASSAPPLAEAPSRALTAEQVVLEPSGYLLGDELVKIEPIGAYDSRPAAERTYSGLELLAILTAITLVGVVALTVPIVALVWLGSRTVETTLASDSYQKAAAALENKRTEALKAVNSVQLTGGIPDHNRTVWSAWSTGIVAVILAYFTGLTVGAGIAEGLGPVLANLAAVVTAVIAFFRLRPKNVAAVEEKEDVKSSYNLMWVLISGAIMMGLGVGLMFIVIGGGDPFPWFTWDPNPAINWSYFADLLAPLAQWN